jgi:hypothetical protein
MAAPKISLAVKDNLLAAYQAVLNEARTEFETDLALQAGEWKIELARTKENDTYEYNKEKRKRSDDLDRELSDRASAVAAREESVGAREYAAEDQADLVEQLSNKVEQLPSLLAQAETVGYRKGNAEAERDYNAEVKLLGIQAKADKQVLDSELKALRESLAQANGVIQTLRAEIGESNKRVETVASAAFTAAGNSKVNIQNTPASK